MTLEQRVHKTLNNAVLNGYDVTKWTPATITQDLYDYDAVLEEAEFREVRDAVLTWLAAKGIEPKKSKWSLVAEKIKELGVREEGGINWTWVRGFRSPEEGQAFVKWLEENGFEHRGYYPAQPDSQNPNLHLDGVRYR